MELKNYSDTELLNLISKNNFKAFKELYNRYHKLLFTLILRICKDDVLAEQILMQVFLIIFKKAKLFPLETDNAYAWIVLLARNRAVDSLRRNRTSENIEVYYDEDFENQYIIPTLCYDVAALDIETAINTEKDFNDSYNSLTEMQKTVIEYAFFEGFTIDEIVAKLNLPTEITRAKIMNSIFALFDKLIKKETIINSENSVILEFISAFSLGCLNRENFDAFVNYYNAGKLDKVSLRLFGELQNIVALLPLTLEPAEIKVNLLEKIKEELIKSNIVFNDFIEPLKDEQPILENNKKEIKEDIEKEIKEDEELNLSNLSEGEQPEIKKEVVKDVKVKLNSTFSAITNKGNKLLFALIALNLFFILLLVIISLSFNSKINKLQERLDIAKEKSDLAFNFVSDYQEFIDFANLGSYKTILLKDSTNFVVARLFISLNDNKALLQVDNLPKIKSDEEYILSWVKNGVSNKIMSFGSYDKKYISINTKESVINADLFKISLYSKKSKNIDGHSLYLGN